MYQNERADGFFMAKIRKNEWKSSVTKLLRFLYKCVKCIDFLVNKDKILIYLKKCVKYSSMDFYNFVKNINISIIKGENNGECKLPRAIYWRTFN